VIGSATPTLRLLAIEDNPGDVRLLREALAEAEGSGVTLESAGSLTDGIARLGPDSFDAVLLDLSLSDSDGLDTITGLRTAAPHIPVVVMTSLADETMAVTAVSLGAQDYLLKGHDPGRVVLRVVRHAIERQRWLEHFAETRKMDAVGRLAGALAHEYNNLLVPVVGYCGLLLPAVRHDPDLSEMVAAIQLGGERAALLTAQLLALSGHKHTRPSSMMLNRAIREAEGMLQETVGSRARLAIRLDAELDAIRFDAHELEHLLAVLAINALEAMPDGGDFIVETIDRTLDAQSARAMDLTPGVYVVLRVRDSSAGMSEEARSRAIEPFVKTGRRETKTTGLSLAALNGTLRASGAHLIVESTLGEGSTFTIYFPRRIEAGIDQVSPAA
jgi:two-component system cell cycle sensor histidine kinase/response regulator CckA